MSAWICYRTFEEHLRNILQQHLKLQKVRPWTDEHYVFLLHRKCKLNTTGPWQEIPPLTLSDVTILPCAAQNSVDVVPLWAISNKGDVLCRLGVTALTPAVSHVYWMHTDTPMSRLWTIQWVTLKHLEPFSVLIAAVQNSATLFFLALKSVWNSFLTVINYDFDTRAQADLDTLRRYSQLQQRLFKQY